MNRFFNKFKNKKNKLFYYILFWIFFPLTIIALIVSLCFAPSSMGNDKSSAYGNSVVFNINYSNNTAGTSKQQATQQANEVASRIVSNLKTRLNSIDVEPYVYQSSSNPSDYFYGIKYIFPASNPSSLFGAYYDVYTVYDNSNLLTLDSIQTKNLSSYSNTLSYYNATTIAGLIPNSNIYNDIYTNSGSKFIYSSTKSVTSGSDTDIQINVDPAVNVSNVINNSKYQYFLWQNKAAFVTLCDNLYNLEWLIQHWDYVGNNSPIPSQYDNDNSNDSSYYDVFSSFLQSQSSSSSKSFSSFADFAASLYNVVGNEGDPYVFNDTSSNVITSKSTYNLITVQNIDNILLSPISTSNPSKTLYSEYKSVIDSYVLADITSSNYKTYFVSENPNSTLDTYKYSSTIDIPTSSEVAFKVQSLKNNYLNPLISPNNINSAAKLNGTTYSNVNLNPFGIWNNIEELKNNINATSSTSSTSSTSNSTTSTSEIALFDKNILASTSSTSYGNLPFNISNNQSDYSSPASISYTNNYSLTNSITNIPSWKAIFISILVVILIIGIIVSILYRFPGLIAWIISTATLGISSLIYESLSMLTTNGALMSYLMSYIITIFLFLFFLQKVDEIYKSGISYKLAFIKGLRYYLTYGFDLHVIIFLSSIAFVYFSTFEVQTIGIVIAIYFALSFLLNYLFGLFILYIYSNFGFEINYKFYTSKKSWKQNLENYEEVSSFVSLKDPNTHYDLSSIEALLTTKNTLTSYATPKKFFKYSLIIISSITIFLIIVFIISYVTIYYVKGQQATLFSYNNLGLTLFDQINIISIISIGFSSFYFFIRFGKGIIYFVTTSISVYLFIAFFIFSNIDRNIQNDEGLVLSIFLIVYINAYFNITLNHLFRFKKDVSLKNGLNLIINVIYKQWKNYTLLWSVIIINMVINYIFNSEDLFIFNMLLFIGFFVGFFVSISLTPWLRYLYLIIKVKIFNNDKQIIKIKNYDVITEQDIEGINTFGNIKNDKFIYE